MSQKQSLLWVVGGVVLAVSLSLAACSGGGGESPTAPPAPVVNPSATTSSFGTEFVEFASIDIEKATNGVDADFPPGVIVTVGSPIEWTYRITNNGNEDLVNVAVVDSIEGPVTCPTELAANASAECDPIQGLAGDVAYTNTAEVTAETATGEPVSDSDDSNYTPGDVAISLDVQKLTNGEDADSPTGPVLPDLISASPSIVSTSAATPGKASASSRSIPSLLSSSMVESN